MTGESERRVAELEQEVERLEAANAELRRVNTRLAGNRAGKLDSAAAGALLREQAARPSSGGRLRARAKASLRSLALRILR